MSVPPDTGETDVLDLARRVLTTEAAAIAALVDRLGGPFIDAVRLLLECRGRVIVTGMGKSGIIGRKLAATLSSTGTPAFFLHPAEAIHGDLGVVQADDVVIAISHGGETEEVLRVLAFIRRLGARAIALTGRVTSSLATAADVTLDCHVDEEACPMNLAPTASTTATLAMGDALSMALLVRKGFQVEDFAKLHPGGKLGKRLMRVEQLMHRGHEVPSVTIAADMRHTIYEMSSKGLGMTCVVDAQARLRGIITDGDLRRLMERNGLALDATAGECMTPNPVTIGPRLLAVDALKILEERRISSLIVRGPDDTVLGVLHLHDLWRTEMF